MNQQLELWTTRETITELCVDVLARDDAELRAIASDLLVLVRYHEQKAKA